MAQVLYSATMSLDGFIAGPGGDMSWLTPFMGELDSGEPAGEIGALLIGARTYRGDDPNRGTESEGAYGGTWSGPSFVLTHHPGEDADVTFLDDLAQALAAAKEAAGEGYVSILGADVARQCLEAGELDEILVYVVPILLGDGTRLFDHPGGRQVRLERLPLAGADGITTLRARVLR